MTNPRIESFAQAFDLERHGYSPPTFFEKGQFGFSTLKEPDFPLKGVVVPDDGRLVTLIHVAIEEEDLASDKPKKPIYCRMQFVRERQGRFMVDEAMLKQIKNRPIDLISTDEYFYDTAAQIFFRGNTQIEARQFLDELYRIHKKAAMNLRGLRLRTSVRLQNLSVSALEGTAKAWAYVHKLIYDEKVEYNPILIAFPEKTGTTSQTGEIKKEGKKLPFFGYDANVNLIVAYCVIHLAVYLYLFYFNLFPLILRQIFTNNFLTVLYVIVTLAILETILKKLSQRIVVAFGSWAFNLSVRNFKL